MKILHQNPQGVQKFTGETSKFEEKYSDQVTLSVLGHKSNVILPYKVNVFLVPNLVIIKSYQFHTCACAHSHSIMLTLCDTLDCLDSKLLCAWDSSGKSPGVGCRFPPPGDLPDSRDQTVSPASLIAC